MQIYIYISYTLLIITIIYKIYYIGESSYPLYIPLILSILFLYTPYNIYLIFNYRKLISNLLLVKYL